MEEILASIRRIIADDDATKSGQHANEASKSVVPAVPAAPSAVSSPIPKPPAPTPTPEPDPPLATPEQALSETVPEPPAADAASMGGANEEQSPDILDLTESMASAASEAPQFRTIDGSSDIGFDESPEKVAPQNSFQNGNPSFAAERIGPGVAERTQLLSKETSAAVDSAFNALAQTVLVQNARTLEDLVREMLRPMLKAWLDDNLPGIVERLVRAEIERVSRGRLG